MNNTCAVIGVLDNGVQGLTPSTLNLMQQADLVIAASRTLHLFSEIISRAEQYDLTGKLTQVPSWIETALKSQRQVVVLATGDPLCHGIAGFLVKKLGAEKLTIYPNVSSIQLACARFAISWQDMKICSVHSKDAGEWQPGAGPEHGLYPLLQVVTQHNKLAVLTGPENNPARIARMLISEQLDQQFDMMVAEDLLKPEERLFKDLTMAELAEQTFSGNDVVLLLRKSQSAADIVFGFQDDAFKQRKPDKGLITKREIRAVSLARMQLTKNSIVWDIGAGSGSVGIEVAKIAVDGHVFAIEKNEADFAIAQENAQRFNVHNYSLKNAKAPDGLAQWPVPDAVFIGGSGGNLADLIAYCLEKLADGGCLVMNFVTVENLHTAIETLKQSGYPWDFVQMQASRSQPILHMHRMQAENPVWIVTVQKVTE